MKKSSRFLFILFLLACAAGLYVILAFRLVRTEEGYHFIRKKKLSLSADFIDTRDWTVLDHLKNPEISTELLKGHLEDLQASATRYWDDFSKSLDEFAKKHSLDDLSDESETVKQQLEKLKLSAREKYQELLEKFEKGNLNLDQFKQKTAEVGAWFEKEVAELRARFDKP